MDHGAARHDEEGRKNTLTKSIKLLVYNYEKNHRKRDVTKGERARAL